MTQGEFPSSGQEKGNCSQARAPHGQTDNAEPCARGLALPAWGTACQEGDTARGGLGPA